MSRVVLGVTGGIAAFRACDLVGRLREQDVDVRVAMTPGATRFVTPLTFAALSGHEVLVEELSGHADPDIAHISWARWADLVLVAPATADFLARAAHGFGDDSLACLLLALDPGKPIVLAPAMNVAMWQNPLVQANVRRLIEVEEGRRFRFVDPTAKRLACGEVGIGGLASTEEIVAATLTHLRG